MKLEGIDEKRKHLICGAFPWLFWAVALMVAVFALMLDEVFLPVVVFWPIGHALSVYYTIHQLRQMSPAERQLYIVGVRHAQKKKK